jgi:hypothetical protein
MTHALSRLALGGVRAAFAPAARSLRASHADPARAQARLLRELATRAARTEYGRHHRVRSADDFRARLPVVAWSEVAPWVAEQMAREGRILVDEPVRFYEKTSGSSGAAKHVPYTTSLLRSFARAFAAWAHDVLARGPRLCTGAMYFCVSPSFAAAETTANGVPVGLDDDADYLGPALRALLSPFFVVPPGAARERDPARFKRAVCAHLARSRRLEIVSVWNPSFLSVLLDWIEEHRADLAADLRARRDPRADALASSSIDWATLWPELKLVSCWASASAAPLASALARRLPHVTLQPKGLLATEAPLTIPSFAAGGFVPLVDDVLYELEESDGAPLQLLHEAQVGKTYALVISQRGGLSRYRIGDRVRVTRRYGATPCLDFVGRGDDTSDLVGEKLTEPFVASALASIDLGDAFFRALVPSRTPREHYVLLLDAAPRDRARVEDDLERALCRAHHYAHARALGQLAPARVVVAPRIEDAVRDDYARRGVKWGDRKHRLLETRPADALLREVHA